MQKVISLLVVLTINFTMLTGHVYARPVLAPLKDGWGGGGYTVDKTPSEPLVKKVESGALKKPILLTELSRTDNSTQVYSVDQAAKLGFSFGASDAKYSRRIYVKNFVMYKEIKEGEAKVWYGIGVRWLVNVKIIDANAKLTGVPFIAAAADSKTVEASSQFQVVGLNNPEISKIANSIPSDLNLESYGQVYAAFGKITDLISAKETKVTPEIVARVIEDKDEEQGYANGIVTSWALSHIASGKTLLDAQSSFPEATLSEKELLKSVYVYYLHSDSQTTTPSAVAKAKAVEILKGLKLKK